MKAEAHHSPAERSGAPKSTPQAVQLVPTGWRWPHSAHTSSCIALRSSSCFFCQSCLRYHGAARQRQGSESQACSCWGASRVLDTLALHYCSRTRLAKQWRSPCCGPIHAAPAADGKQDAKSATCAEQDATSAGAGRAKQNTDVCRHLLVRVVRLVVAVPAPPLLVAAGDTSGQHDRPVRPCGRQHRQLSDAAACRASA